jgi:predicted membrane protein (TIGR00267 family)
MSPLQRLGYNLRQLLEYGELANIGEIARRYFAMNAFDGVLTIIGVLTGSYSAQVRNPSTVIVTGLSTSVAMGISGLWGAYLTESAERKRDLAELEGYTLTDLSQTKIGRASQTAVVIVALVDGLAPFCAALVVLLPFFLTSLWANITISYYIALGLALVVLFGLGAFLGTISRQSMIISGAKMIVAGLVAILASYLLRATGV